jgi:hypothetical protein
MRLNVAATPQEPLPPKLPKKIPLYYLSSNYATTIKEASTGVVSICGF